MNNKQRLKIHQDLFKKIHICTIAHDNARITRIIDLIRSWSFAFNANNGEASETQVKRMQDRILEMLEEI